MNILFVCSMAALRSDTAAQIYIDRGYNARCAGTADDALVELTPELVEWSDIIFCMEREHRIKLRKKHKDALDTRLAITLDIEDEYYNMQPELIELIFERMAQFEHLIN